MTPNEQEAPHLSEQYYKTRKSLVLFSGLLFAYELIGIDIRSQPLENLAVEVRSPQATPWALLILVLYFMLRYVIEWYQSSYLRRNMRVAKIDFTSTLIISGLALATFGIQRILDIQIADKIFSNPQFLWGAFSVFFGSISLIYPLIRGPLFGFKYQMSRFVKSGVAFIFLYSLAAGLWSTWRYGWEGHLLGGLFGLLLTAMVPLMALSVKIIGRILKAPGSKDAAPNLRAGADV